MYNKSYVSVCELASQWMDENPNVRLLGIITGRGRETSAPRVAVHLHHAATVWETDTPTNMMYTSRVGHAEPRLAQYTPHS